MLKYLFPKLTLAALFAVLSVPAFSQAAPAAEQGGLPLAVGGGFSDFSTDFGPIRMYGAAAWADWSFYGRPRFLQGFGLEAEARDLNYGKPASYPGKLRQDTVMGGATYTWRHFHSLNPYVKFMLGYGVVEFAAAPGTNPYYTLDSRTIYGPGGGLEYRVFRNVSLRADYEYQAWPNLFGSKTLDPNGFTFGAMYDLRGLHAR
jgi:opacity protein-like surface antigen